MDWNWFVSHVLTEEVGKLALELVRDIVNLGSTILGKEA